MTSLSVCAASPDRASWAFQREPGTSCQAKKDLLICAGLCGMRCLHGQLIHRWPLVRSVRRGAMDPNLFRLDMERLFDETSCRTGTVGARTVPIRADRMEISACRLFTRTTSRRAD